jgi:hypothetical protein
MVGQSCDHPQFVAGVDQAGNLICEVVDGASSIGETIRVFEHFPLETPPGDYELLRAGGFIIIARFRDFQAGGGKAAEIMLTHESDIFSDSGEVESYHGSSPGSFRGFLTQIDVRFDELDNAKVRLFQDRRAVTVEGEALVVLLAAASFVDNVFEIGLEVKHIPNLADYFSEELSAASGP